MKGDKFARIEQKYILNEEEYRKIQKYIKKNFLKDKYYESKITNIYFDNYNNEMMINSIEKPPFKKKVRVRSYGDGYYYLEVKEKYKGIVYKRRIKLTKEEFDDYMNKGIIPNINNKQIMNELDYYIKYYGIKPYIYVAYDRLSYYSKDDTEFRITFDTNLRYRFDNLCLSDEYENREYFNEKKYIMEVKAMGSLPYEFVRYLSHCKIYPGSFSKVGSIYMKERESKTNMIYVKNIEEDYVEGRVLLESC